jgi:hypothetical protein
MLTQGSLTQKKITQKRLTQFSPYFNRQGTFFNPLFWYEPDFVEKDLSGAVSIVYDKSGNGFHLVQSTQVSKPLLIENYQNGQPALRFDGSNDFMRVAFGQTFAQPNTIYFVFKNITGGNRFFYDGIASTERHAKTYRSGDEIWMFTSDANTRLTIPYSSTLPLSIIKDEWNTSNSKSFRNGALLGSGNVLTQSLKGLTVGVNNNLGAGFFGNFDFCALLGFNRLMSFSEDLNVMNYLNTKYGVF